MVVIMNFGMMGIIMTKVPNMSLYKTMIIVFVRIMIIINTMFIMGSATKVTIMPPCPTPCFLRRSNPLYSTLAAIYSRRQGQGFSSRAAGDDDKEEDGDVEV